jgi:hypothetical protein
MSLFQNREQEGKTELPVWGVGTRRREEDIRKGVGGEYGRNIMCSCV